MEMEIFPLKVPNKVVIPALRRQRTAQSIGMDVIIRCGLSQVDGVSDRDFVAVLSNVESLGRVGAPGIIFHIVHFFPGLSIFLLQMPSCYVLNFGRNLLEDKTKLNMEYLVIK